MALVVVVVGVALAEFIREVIALLDDPGEDQAVEIIVLMGAGRDICEMSQDGVCPSPAAVQDVLNKLGTDTWGHMYQYEVSPNHAYVARLFSLGRDGHVGGDGADTDVVMWIDAEHGLRTSYSLEDVPFGLLW